MSAPSPEVLRLMLSRCLFSTLAFYPTSDSFELFMIDSITLWQVFSIVYRVKLDIPKSVYFKWFRHGYKLSGARQVVKKWNNFYMSGFLCLVMLSVLVVVDQIWI